jgi:hypothetical protein
MGAGSHTALLRGFLGRWGPGHHYFDRVDDFSDGNLSTFIHSNGKQYRNRKFDGNIRLRLWPTFDL